MAGIDLAAGIIAVIQITDQVIRYSSQYIEALRNAPRDLYIIRIETLSLRASLESLQYLYRSNDLARDNIEGLIAGCGRTLADLESLLSSTTHDSAQGSHSRIQRVLSSLAWPTKQEKARSLLDEVLRYKTSISLVLLRNTSQDLQHVTDGVHHLSSIVSSHHNELRSKSDVELLQWIAPLNVMYRDAHESALAKRFGSTGSWLLQREEYRRWCSRGGTFCLDGFAGVGKSVLSSVVVQDLSQRAEAEDFVVLYYYFSMKDATRNYLAALYDTLVRQILQNCQIGYADVAELAKKLNYGHPSRDDYATLCKRLLARMRRVYLVIDGVDTYDCRELPGLLDFLDELLSFAGLMSGVNAQDGQNSQTRRPPDEKLPDERLMPQLTRSRLELRLFFTTRDHSQVARLFRQDNYGVRLTKELVEQDIRTFTEGHIYGMDEESRNAMGKPLQQRTIDRIVEKSEGLFIQAAMHVEHITNLCTVEEIEEAINNLSGELHKTYRTIILDIWTKYPGAKNHALLKRMFIWLCQANYCLPLPEFVALVTMNAKDGFVNRKAIPMRPEAFCRRLGPLLNLDRHVYPPEVNLSHATMEQYLQSDALRDDPSLGELHVSPLDAQKFLAEACLRFLQMDDFRTPLSDKRTGRENPFKGLYGGLGFGAGHKKYDWVVKMKERLRPLHGCVGVEYASVNWPEHVHRAGYTVKEFRERVLPILDDWFRARDLRYRSWQEAHAYFCFFSECQCHEWQEPEEFLETFQLLELYRRAKSGRPEDDNHKFTTENVPDADKGVEPSKCSKLRYGCSRCSIRKSFYARMQVPDPATGPEGGEGQDRSIREERSCAGCSFTVVLLKERLGKIKESRQENTRFARGWMSPDSMLADSGRS